MSKVHHLTYFGDIRGLVGDGKTIAFVTEHGEGKLTSLYLVDGETEKESERLKEIPLNFVPTSMIKGTDCFWVGGNDAVLYCAGVPDKKVTAHKAKLSAPATAMALVSNDQIALLCGETVEIVEANAKAKGKLVQTIELDEVGTSIASHPEGNWIAVGSKSGTVSVFQREEQEEFLLSESEKLHDGVVTSLLFEPDELRFFSAGNDHKLLLTHARGRLEPEDRGRANNHEKPITSMILAGDYRFITGSLDKSCKSWSRAGATKPQTQADCVIAVHHLAIVEIHGRPNLVVACADNSLRLFLIDEDGRIGNLVCRFNDAYARAAKLFDSSDAKQRGESMQDLHAIDDRVAAEMLGDRISSDPDSKLRLTATQLLAKSKHPQLVELLSTHLSHQDSPVRMHVLKTLESIHPDPLGLYQTVLLIDHTDVGIHTVESLVKIATKKGESKAICNRAQSVLVSALDVNSTETRNAAILGLEKLFEKKSPRANLMTLDCKNTDTKRKGIIRLLQRGLLEDSAAQAGLRRAVEDRSADVRQTAFYVSVLSRPDLAKELRKRDKDIDRQLKEIEKFDFKAGLVDSATKPASTKGTRKKVAKKKAVKKKRS